MTLEEITSTIKHELNVRIDVTMEGWLAARRGDPVDQVSIARAIREEAILKQALAALDPRFKRAI